MRDARIPPVPLINYSRVSIRLHLVQIEFTHQASAVGVRFMYVEWSNEVEWGSNSNDEIVALRNLEVMSHLQTQKLLSH